MDDELLKRVQKEELEIALEIKRICDLNNINYFLDGGTLLGAIRHNGFIPWDDDFDIGMLRDDYEKFILCANSQLGENYTLQTKESEYGYGLAFLKIRKKGTLFLEEKASSALKNNGFFVDVFPYDTFPNDKSKQKSQKFGTNYYKRLILAKTGHKPWIIAGKLNFKKWVIYLPLRVISKMFDKNVLCSKFEKYAKMYNKEYYEEVYPQGITNYGRFHINKDVLAYTEEHEFENTSFKIPKQYDLFLKLLYGDYMKLPPESERMNRHGIYKINFNGDQL